MPTPDAHHFDAATAVRPSTGPGLFESDVDPWWAVGDKPNGGYLQALLGRAARATGGGEGPPRMGGRVGRSDVPAPTGRRARRHPDRAPRGHSASQVRAVLTQGGLHGHDRAPAPSGDHSLPGVASAGRRAGRDPGWTRFDDGRPPTLSLLFTVDAVPPPTYMIGSSGWVPTLQMSTYVRARPAPGWLKMRISANVVANVWPKAWWTRRVSSGTRATTSWPNPHSSARLRFPGESG